MPFKSDTRTDICSTAVSGPCFPASLPTVSCVFGRLACTFKPFNLKPPSNSEDLFVYILHFFKIMKAQSQ